MQPMQKLVIMAGGLGTRMRRAEGEEGLTDQQAAAAESGVKALMPIDRPFLDYVLSVVADAGYKQLCLVIAPNHDALRDYYGRQLQLRRLELAFAVQAEPLGTADAVRAAEDFAGEEPFAVINSDNYYPVEALRALRQMDGPGLAVFDRQAMVDGSNIDGERLTKFAVVQTSADGYLDSIIEKPDPQTLAALPEPIGVSMNCWRFGPEIFQACRSIDTSQRGEYELPAAVQYAIDRLNVRFEVRNIDRPVLDLSSRGDVAPVAERLRGVQVCL